jgi:glutathione peroxidase-family protein
MKIRTKAPNFALAKELNENMNKSTKFWLKGLHIRILGISLVDISNCQMDFLQLMVEGFVGENFIKWNFYIFLIARSSIIPLIMGSQNLPYNNFKLLLLCYCRESNSI